MKKRVSLFFIIIIFIWIVFLVIRQSNKKNAVARTTKVEEFTDVKIIKPVVDFGSVPCDTVVSAVFNIINTGNSLLKVDFVNPDCMCTEYYYPKKPTSPGDTLCITLKVDTKNKIGEQDLVTVIKLNTKEKLYKLMLKMNVL